MVFCAKSFMAKIFAPDNPALRSVDLRMRSISSGVGALWFVPKALTRAKIVAAAFPEMD